jgi:ATP-binding cassette, subfamily B, bacterial CvaB/MchF/RaxB
LDGEIERRVNAAVKVLPLTRITIAHRQETINAAERVIVLAGGSVVRDLNGIRAA